MRLAKLLLDHLDGKESTSGLRLIHHLPRETIAAMIGTVRQVVSRHLQAPKPGAIEYRRGRLLLKDAERITAKATKLGNDTNPSS